MTKVKRNVLVAVIAVGVIVLGCFIAHKRWEYNLLKEIRDAPPEKKARLIARNYDFVLSRILPGMTKQQVERTIGAPQNSDSEHVWAWAYPSAVPLNGDEGWIDLMRRSADIVSVVFLDGRAIGSHGLQCGVVMPPPNTVMVTKDCDMRTALELLGVAPKDIEEYLQDEEESRRLWAEMLSTPKPQKEKPDTPLQTE